MRFRVGVIACSVIAVVLGGVWALCSLHVPIPEPSRPLPEAAETTEPPANGPIQLRDVTAQTGIGFVHTHGGSGRRYVVETISAGLALFDYDGDGDEDIYFLNGAPLQGTETDARPVNALYRNEGQWRFTDVTQESGTGDPGYGLGVAVGDYDNDGDPDIYLNNFGPNVLLRNNGDGTFTDVSEEAGVADGNKVGAGACFLDMDGDGDLDLYSSNYVKFSYDSHITRFYGGFHRYPSPKDHDPEPDTLFRNNGDGTFTDVSIESGVGTHAGTGMGMVGCDYDTDGDTDVFVCNDVFGNFFFRNDGQGKFEEVALAVGVAYNLFGAENGSMGVECGDYDNDGELDFYMTSYQSELPVLYRNLGDGSLEDVTMKTGAGAGLLPHVNWGSGLVDFDNDGARDLYVACGHLQDLIDKMDSTTSFHARNVLLWNTHDGKFVNVSDSGGDGMLVKLASRGAAFGDLDNDGRVDAVILNINLPPTILRNESVNANHWLQIRVRGVKTNRDGVGARVTVAAGDLVQIDEIHAGRGYQSHYGSRLHFGLGNRDRVDRVEVRWIGGGVDVVENVAVDQVLTITEQATGPHAEEKPDGERSALSPKDQPPVESP